MEKLDTSLYYNSKLLTMKKEGGGQFLGIIGIV
jgi:hypothetical protein